MRISDWSSDVCSSDLFGDRFGVAWICRHHISNSTDPVDALAAIGLLRGDGESEFFLERPGKGAAHRVCLPAGSRADLVDGGSLRALQHLDHGSARRARSEEHTSELQSLMRITYAVFCLKTTTSTATNLLNENN